MVLTLIANTALLTSIIVSQAGQTGMPAPDSAGVSSVAEVRDFVARVGYPIILKPRDGAGASGATRVDSDAELAWTTVNPSASRARAISSRSVVISLTTRTDGIATSHRPKVGAGAPLLPVKGAISRS